MEPVLRVEKRDGVATLTLNRPDKLNALNSALRRALIRALEDAARDDAVQVVILTGAGRAFCAGVDLHELAAGENTAVADAGAGADDASMRLPAAFEACERPIIGAINGVAVTGGFELALLCDVLLCTPDARFADTHARVGILPGWGLSQRLARAVGPYRAKALSLTGNYLDAAQAERLGLVHRIVAPGELLASARALADDMLGCPPGVVSAYKKIIDQGYATSFAEGLRLEAEAAVAQASTVSARAVGERRGAVMERGRRQSGRQSGREGGD